MVGVNQAVCIRYGLICIRRLPQALISKCPY